MNYWPTSLEMAKKKSPERWRDQPMISGKLKPSRISSEIVVSEFRRFRSVLPSLRRLWWKKIASQGTKNQAPFGWIFIVSRYFAQAVHNTRYYARWRTVVDLKRSALSYNGNAGISITGRPSARELWRATL